VVVIIISNIDDVVLIMTPVLKWLVTRYIRNKYTNIQKRSQDMHCSIRG